MRPIPVYRQMFAALVAGMSDQAWREVVMSAFEDMATTIDRGAEFEKLFGKAHFKTCFLQRVEDAEPYAALISFDAYQTLAAAMPEDLDDSLPDDIVRLASELVQRPAFSIDDDLRNAWQDAEARVHRIAEILSVDGNSDIVVDAVRDLADSSEAQASKLRDIRAALGGQEGDLVEIIGRFSRELHSARQGEASAKEDRRIVEETVRESLEAIPGADPLEDDLVERVKKLVAALEERQDYIVAIGDQIGGEGLLAARVERLIKDRDKEKQSADLLRAAGGDVVRDREKEIAALLGIEGSGISIEKAIEALNARLAQAEQDRDALRKGVPSGSQVEMNERRIAALRDIREALGLSPANDRPMVEVIREILSERDSLKAAATAAAPEAGRENTRQKALADVRDALGLQEGFSGYIADHVRNLVAERDELRDKANPAVAQPQAAPEKPVSKPRPWTAGYTPEMCHEVLTRLADREDVVPIASVTRIPGGTKTVSNIAAQYGQQIEHAKALVGQPRIDYLASVLKQMQMRVAASKKEGVNA